jgi:hypothetical protein
VSVPASFFLALPAAAVSTVAFVLACIGSSIVVCGCCKDKDGNPGGHISCGVLCLLSFIFRLVALVVLLIFFLPLLYLSFLAGSYFGIIALRANDRADRCYGARRACTRHPVHYMGVRQRGSRSSSWCSRSSGVNDGTERHSASAGRASGRHGSELTSSCRLCSYSRSRPRSLGITEIHMQWRPMHSADRTTWWGGTE